MRTLAAPFSHEEEIKKSRFVAHAGRADEVQSALDFIARNSHPDASHNCWAYLIGNHYRFNDDGEPASTAGKPIFSAIQGGGLDHVVIVVVRYFGGIKLGAGGLARAYGGCAASCLRQAETLEVVARQNIEINAPFDQIGAIYPLLERFEAVRVQESYRAAGIHLLISLPVTRIEELRAATSDATRGSAHFMVTNTPGKDEA